jgi:hypothetical protein
LALFRRDIITEGWEFFLFLVPRTKKAKEQALASMFLILMSSISVSPACGFAWIDVQHAAVLDDWSHWVFRNTLVDAFPS